MTTLVFDPSARSLEGGRLLIGGHPARLLRLTAAGARMVDAWRAGEAVGSSDGARRLADRLVAAGLAHPRPLSGAITSADVAVVIPTRDRPDALAECLARVGSCREIVIVDDGSTDPAAITATATAAREGARGAAQTASVPSAPGAAPPTPDAAPPTPDAAPPTPDAAPPTPAAAPPVPDGTPSSSAAASASPVAIRVVRRDVSGGPAAARNAGLAATDAPFVAFLDSDTLPTAGWLEPLLAHFGDPCLAAVAPRVRVPLGRSALARYEAVRSPLDLGPAPGIVGPGRRVGYVPAAALVVRRAAVDTGFDEDMRYGEDVDLVWRLAAAGWTVRYEPASVVEHPHRATLTAWLRQRAAYGSSAGPLARRHPGKLRHVVVPRDALLPWALALAGRPALALLAALPRDALRAAVTAPRGSAPGSPLLAGRGLARLSVEAKGRVARQIADAAWRAHAPALVVTRRGRRFLAGALLAGGAADYLTKRPALDPLRFTALRAADDLAYAAGVWAGCARARTAAPLIPEVRRRRSP